MALTAGSKPTSYSSTLTGLALRLYNDRISNSVALSESAQSTTIGDDTFTEAESLRQNRVYKEKLKAYSDAKSIIDELQANAEIKNSTLLTIETYAAGAGTNGGSLVASSYPVVGSVVAGINVVVAKVY